MQGEKKKRVCFKLAIESSREIVLEELEFLRYLKKTKRKSIVNYEQTKLEKLDEWLSLIQLKRIWILSQKQMFQRLSIELTNLKAGNTSEYLPNKIGQTFYGSSGKLFYQNSGFHNFFMLVFLRYIYVEENSYRNSWNYLTVFTIECGWLEDCAHSLQFL